ncbi:cadherin-1-like [Amphiprion ocellaris]|uniref:cadherin-1-like n=1 Tax=Amphiprion ocellaris TaxID=80972 RepID=UPI0024113D2A|nr:cadherin-1-like [Amphiprion ocellaris]
MTVPVRVVHDGHHHGHHHQNVEHHHGQNHVNDTESATDPQESILHFPKSGEGLRRRKREWVIPDLSVVENDRGPYPLKVSQIRSNEDKIKKIFYSITGPGADQPPAGLFTMDRTTGILYLTQPLDRERQDKYMVNLLSPSFIHTLSLSKYLSCHLGMGTDSIQYWYRVLILT